MSAGNAPMNESQIEPGAREAMNGPPSGYATGFSGSSPGVSYSSACRET